MKTETLPIARKSGRARSPQRGPGRILRMLLAVAIIAAGSWYALPRLNDLLSEQESLTNNLVTTDDVNMRSGPGLEHGVITVIPAGEQVAASMQPESGYLQVEFNGHRGWTSETYLSSPNRVIAQSQTVAEVPPEPEPTAAIIVAETEPTQAPVEEVPTPVPTPLPTIAPTVPQPTELAGAPMPGEKWIDVNRTTRVVTLYNGDIVVAQFDALIGEDLSAEGYYSTALGTFYVYVKEKALAETPFAEGVYLTDFVGFDPYRSNGFHSPVRDEFGNVVVTGGTSTLGCVRLSEDDAIFLFNFAQIGTRVVIHD